MGLGICIANVTFGGFDWAIVGPGAIISVLAAAREMMIPAELHLLGVLSGPILRPCLGTASLALFVRGWGATPAPATAPPGAFACLLALFPFLGLLDRGSEEASGAAAGLTFSLEPLVSMGRGLGLIGVYFADHEEVVFAHGLQGLF